MTPNDGLPAVVCAETESNTLFLQNIRHCLPCTHTHVIAQPIRNRECLNVLPLWEVLLLLSAKAVLKATNTARSPVRFESNPIGPWYGRGSGDGTLYGIGYSGKSLDEGMS